MDINLDEIRGPLAGFLAAAMIFASAGTVAASQDNTAQASAVRTIIQTEINAAGTGSNSTSEGSAQQSEDSGDTEI